MANFSSTPTAKYVIHAKIEVNGVVEKPDVVGAIFGQTEGLFGPELDLKELQKNNRVGRIEVEVKNEHGKTYGTITVASSLDKVSTAILAAAIESVERVGPWEAKVTIEKIEDLRETKRRQIVRRAKEILRRWIVEKTPEADEVIREVSSVLKPPEIVLYGPEQLPAGPDVDSAQSIIVVEGRADVHNLLRCGVRNVIAIDGARIPETIVKLSKNKQIIVFLDGDRAGDLILKEILETVDVKYVARAPPGKEVEELTCKEIMNALRERVPVSEVKIKYARVSLPQKIVETVENLKGTLEAVLFNEDLDILARIPVSELAEKISSLNGVSVVVFDGIITQRIIDLAEEKGIKYIIGDQISDVVKKPVKLRILTFDEVAPEKSGM
ncbi:DNA primase [Candidatus Bathyarchaeota archaeon]|nr:MAG: DNA primase [Candidatus Bathyarchaeota archaeon]